MFTPTMTSHPHINRAVRVTAAVIALSWCAGAAAQAQATSNVQPATSTQRSAASVDPAKTPRRPASSAPADPHTDTSREAAKAALSAPDVNKLRPTGTVTVTADRAELVQGTSAVYEGHVTLTSSTLKMHGDRLEVKQKAKRTFVATLTGKPATLSHAGTPPDDPPVTAHANTLVFNSATQLVTLTGDAQLTRGQNIVDGHSIRYNAISHRVQASGGGGKGQVRMVIKPPPPASAAPPPAPRH